MSLRARSRRTRFLVTALVFLGAVLLVGSVLFWGRWHRAVAAAERERQQVRGDFAPETATYISMSIVAGESQARVTQKLLAMGFTPSGDPTRPARALFFHRWYGPALPLPAVWGHPSHGAYEQVSVVLDENGGAQNVWLVGHNRARGGGFDRAVDLRTGETGDVMKFRFPQEGDSSR